MTLHFANFLEFREVVDEGGVDHAIGRGDATPQAFQILKITPMHLRAGSGERLGCRVRASQSKHLMACSC